MDVELFCACRDAAAHDDGTMDIIGTLDRIKPRTRETRVREITVASASAL